MSFVSANKMNKFIVCSFGSLKSLASKRPIEKCPRNPLAHKAFRTVGLRNPRASQED